MAPVARCSDAQREPSAGAQRAVDGRGGDDEGDEGQRGLAYCGAPWRVVARTCCAVARRSFHHISSSPPPYRLSVECILANGIPYCPSSVVERAGDEVIEEHDLLITVSASYSTTRAS